MKMWLYSLGASAMLLSPLAYSSVAGATTLSQVTTTGSVTFNSAISNPSELQGGVSGTTQLSYATNYEEFLVGGTNSSGAVNVDILSTNPYPGETWQLVQGTAGGTVVATGTPSNAEVGVTLVAGDDYFLEFNSTGAPNSPGAQNGWSVEVTPLPGALLLFAGGLGLLGMTGMRKAKMSGRLPTSAVA
jgi:hypothetical protein